MKGERTLGICCESMARRINSFVVKSIFSKTCRSAGRLIYFIASPPEIAAGNGQSPSADCLPFAKTALEKDDRAMGGQTNFGFVCPGRMTTARIALDLSSGKK